MSNFASLLGLSPGAKTSKVQYVVGGMGLDSKQVEEVAQLLAEEAMLVRCGAQELIDIWRIRRDGGISATGAKQQAIKTYACIGFGPPEKPANSDHLQGLIAELFWNRIMRERTSLPDGRRLVHAHSVKPDPLEPGGDGLVIYDTDGSHVFRLWEIKKHETKKIGVAPTVGRAARQLSSRGAEYLAKLAGPETIHQDGQLGDFYASMLELWFDRSERCGIGISIGTSAHHAPKRATPFKSILGEFPQLANPGQTEAIVVALPDFPKFAERVREIVWSGL